MTTERIAELEALCAAATLGPWYFEPKYRTVNDKPSVNAHHMICTCCRPREENLRFIAAAREALPEALAVIREQMAEIDRLKAKEQEAAQQSLADDAYREYWEESE